MLQNLASSAPHMSHPFRRTLPSRVLMRLPDHEPEVRSAMERAALARAATESASMEPAPFCAGRDAGRSGDADAPAYRSVLGRISLQDVKDFLMAYCACLLAIGTILS